MKTANQTFFIKKSKSGNFKWVISSETEPKIIVRVDFPRNLSPENAEIIFLFRNFAFSKPLAYTFTSDDFSPILGIFAPDFCKIAEEIQQYARNNFPQPEKV